MTIIFGNWRSHSLFIDINNTVDGPNRRFYKEVYDYNTFHDLGHSLIKYVNFDLCDEDLSRIFHAFRVEEREKTKEFYADEEYGIQT
eukprot:UN04658